jgi:phosphoglycolate phosphatase
MTHFTAPLNGLCLLKPDVSQRLGHIRHALFDFDGTLSALREGWDGVMIRFMLESICGGPSAPPEIERAVRDYVDRSTGALTIHQMKWLAETVAQTGLVKNGQTAREYKARYVERIQAWIEARKAALARGSISPDDLMISGAQAFLTGLARQSVRLYLASGTDDVYVLEEARCLGLAPFFGPRIYGAQGNSDLDQKELVIRRIVTENGLSGAELLVVGDGPVEIRQAVEFGAIALGVASDEVKRTGWNPHKIQRLTAAGADLLVPDFGRWNSLLDFLTHGVTYD